MPLGYCTRPACADAGQSEDKLRGALAELVNTLNEPGRDTPELPQRKATTEIDLAPMFGATAVASGRFCPSCSCPIGTDFQVCTSCGHLLSSGVLEASTLRLNLMRSLNGFPGQSLTLPQGKCRLTIDHQGLAMVTRSGQKSLVEFEPAGGGGLTLTDLPGFGVHSLCEAPLRLVDGQSLRLGQQLLVVSRSPLGTFPRAGAGSREDLDTRLAAPALRRSPWYLHRLLPNGSVGEMLPLADSMSLGDSACDIDLRDDLVCGVQGNFDASDELHLIPAIDSQIWAQARSGQTLMPSSQIWVGDAIYQLERVHD
jgi:hypothetical protein